MLIKYAVLLALVLVLAVMFGWAFLPARHLPGNRARYLRIRLHLRLHPGKGFAHLFSLWLRWGRLAMLRQAGRVRPALPLGYRLLDPRQHSVYLGRAHYGHQLRVPLEEHLLVIAPPPAAATAFLANVIMGYPGPVMVTATDLDVYALTSAVRAGMGAVHVFNPQYAGGVPATLRWNPVDGCENPATAIRRAEAFAFAVSPRGLEGGLLGRAKAADYLSVYLHAAALAGYDLSTVAAWVSGADPDGAERILAAAGMHHWAATLAELRSAAHDTVAIVRMTMSRALAFMADPALAAWVLPAPGDGFDIPAFLRETGTLYMIAQAATEEIPVAPLFVALATEIRHVAAQLGPASGFGRLDPPLLMGLDEVAQVCPVPLPSWLSGSARGGIQICAVVRGEAQLTGRWGDPGRQAVLDTSSVKVFLPGITDTTTLDAAAKLCGQASWTVRGQAHATRHPVATPDMIRQLPDGFALVIRGGCAPVIARLRKAGKNAAYRRGRRLGELAAEVAAGPPYPVFVPPPRSAPDQMPAEGFRAGRPLWPHLRTRAAEPAPEAAADPQPPCECTDDT